MSGNGTPRTEMEAIDEILSQRNVESSLFRGKKISEQTKAEKLEWFAGELVKEEEQRWNSSIPTVMVKQMVTPRTSSATTIMSVTTASSTSRSRSR